MFEQHPVPQNISSYQFRLVGDMTLKQFLELAGGAVVSLLFYASPLPAILKWPAVVFSALLGAAMAFLPIQDRPLEQWLLAFIRAVYAPTQFKWEKRKTKPQFFAVSASTQQAPENKETEAESTKSGGPSFMKNLEETEKQILSSVASLLNSRGSQPVSTQPTIVNQISHPQPAQQVNSPTQSNQPQTQTPKPDRDDKIILGQDQYQTSPLQKPQDNEEGKVLTEEHEDQEEVVTVRTKHHEVKIPKVNSVKIEEQEKPTGDDLKEIKTTQTQDGFTGLTENQTQNSQPAQFSPDAAPPVPPSQANVIVGQVMDKNKKIIDGAILEIKDENGRPVRALRSNKLGHFLIVTPLNNGSYTISVEKEGFEFDDIKISAKGEIIPPIAIYAKDQKDEHKQ